MKRLEHHLLIGMISLSKLGINPDLSISANEHAIQPTLSIILHWKLSKRREALDPEVGVISCSMT
jgi:hypothetical protein